MAGKLIGQHEISTIGVTKTQAFNATPAEFQIVDPTTVDLPAMYLISADQDCQIKQGSDAVVAAGANSFPLWKKSTIKITVLDEKSSSISVVRLGSTDGTLYVTRNNSADPGSGTDGAA